MRNKNVNKNQVIDENPKCERRVPHCQKQNIVYANKKNFCVFLFSCLSVRPAVSEHLKIHLVKKCREDTDGPRRPPFIFMHMNKSFLGFSGWKTETALSRPQAARLHPRAFMPFSIW